MATSSVGSVSFKKKDGTLVLKADGKAVTWTPVAPPGAPPSLTIPIPTIKNFQATPATSASCMLKISATNAEGTVADYRLTFTSPTNAREELEELKKEIAAAILADKNPTPVPTTSANTPQPDGTPVPALASSSATAGGAAPGGWKGTSAWNTNAKLEADIELQQELLRKDLELGRTFMETVLKGSITMQQFWSTRIHLLRAYAIEKSQARGPYNVLATTKPKTVDNVVSISLSREQIHDIFEQHPLVKKVYDENVPRISESKFWSRFFVSRLFKKLKGEKIVPTDGYDDILDKYLNLGDEANARKKQKIDHVPHFINLDGNEQHVSQRLGNRPDLTMRPEKVENVPLIRTLNSLSMKIVDSVTPLDADVPDRDSRNMEELTLSDLQADIEEERIILKVKDQQKFFDHDHNNPQDQTKKLNTSNPGKVLKRMRNLLSQPIDLAAAAEAASNDNDDNDNDIDPNSQSSSHISAATAQITHAITSRRSILYDPSQQTPSSTSPDTPPTPTNLPPNVHNTLTLTHATTTEFLHHFWLTFLSSSPSLAPSLLKIVTSLKRSSERITAVAQLAEEEKEAEKERRRQAALAEYKATGRKRRKGADDIAGAGGGERVVRELLGPTERAVGFALGKWEEAVKEAEREAEGKGG